VIGTTLTIRPSLVVNLSTTTTAKDDGSGDYWLVCNVFAQLRFASRVGDKRVKKLLKCQKKTHHT